jgi:DNA-binding transcriptional regulator YiaG
LLKSLRWTQAHAARRLGVAPRTMRMWLEEDKEVPPTAAELLRRIFAEECHGLD